MTIKFRNRLISLLCILSLVFLLLNTTIFLVKFFTNSLDLSYFQSFYKNDMSFLFRYNIVYIFAANFLQIFYVTVTSFFLYRTFEKTQAKDIIFFYLILIAFLVDTFRIWIILFNLTGTFTGLLIFCGNASLFAKLLIPISFLLTVISRDSSEHHEEEKILFIILICAFVLALIIPLNTAKILPTCTVSYAFRKELVNYAILSILLTTIFLFYDNYKKEYSQLTTVGILLVAMGIYSTINCTNLFLFILSFVFLTVGTFLYLKNLHKQYLWL